MYRQRAEQADDPIVKNELLELASVCEEVANNIEDQHTAGKARQLGSTIFADQAVAASPLPGSERSWAPEKPLSWD